ncbi:acyl carrier protein [Kitasatospora sp. NPDC056327]|uniref:acyl carrier protein n=1 Tax=Kitasatospora sp. NPDC056327 TaxID=3345785 RepID=UPI0035DF48BA
MSTVRRMLVEVTGLQEFADTVEDGADLAASGIDSGDMVRLVLMIEQHTGAEVTVADLEGLITIADYERFVAGHGGAAGGDGAADAVDAGSGAGSGAGGNGGRA